MTFCVALQIVTTESFWEEEISRTEKNLHLASLHTSDNCTRDEDISKPNS